MKKLFFLLLTGVMFVASCTEDEEDCDDTMVAEHWISFEVRIDVYADENLTIPVDNYPAKATIQKFFCDGDVDMKVIEKGITEGGYGFKTNIQKKPYTNKEDYILLLGYAGPDDAQQQQAYKVFYNEVKYSHYYGKSFVFVVSK